LVAGGGGAGAAVDWPVGSEAALFSSGRWAGEADLVPASETGVFGESEQGVDGGQR